jgi:hypothetical protein
MFSILGHGDLLDVGFGTLGLMRRIVALGNAPDVDQISVPEDVWPGGSLYPWMSGATSLEAVSSSAQDAAGGTGISAISVSLLDTAYVEFTVSVALTGATPTAPFTATAFRINGARSTVKGSGAPAVGATNVGDITIRDAGGGTTRAIIQAGTGIARQSNFTIPAGWTGQVLSQVFGINRLTAQGRFASFATYIQGADGIYRLPLELSVGDEPPYRHDGEPGITLTEKSDFCHRCTSVSADNTNVTAGWLGIMRKNS